MLTGLQSRKLTALFNQLDVDSDGTLNEADFRLVLDRLAASQGLHPRSLHYAYLRSAIMTTWQQLRLADTSSDAEVTLDEWLSYHERLFESELYETRLKALFDVVFNLLDANGDKEIGREEYVALVSAYGVEEDWARENFGRLDLNGDGHISDEELLQLMDEFFRSDDPQSPGNGFWGPY
jgi:Ca2+-binding EF-hand superfamily protein